jgi:hypothetical protein
MKKILTPGRLYARMSDEFRRMRPPDCQSCSMPMIYAIEALDGDCANWLVDEASRSCDACLGLLTGIVRRFSFEYDVYDPAFTTTFRSWDVSPATRAFRH